jgi:hypothetical protein
MYSVTFFLFFLGFRQNFDLAQRTQQWVAWAIQEDKKPENYWILPKKTSQHHPQELFRGTGATWNA